MSELTTDQRVIVWFSCGAASAAAAKIAIDKYGRDRVKVVYCDTSINEHPDNERFFDDVQTWLSIDIERLYSNEFKTVDDVFAKRKYMSGIAGAPCTVALKKIPRFNFQRWNDIHVFGYTIEEQNRVDIFVQNNPELMLDWVLIDSNMTKEDCLLTIMRAKIKLPMMYQLGFKNNNCIGCVKATSTKYWNMTRHHFPEVFERRVKQSRELNVRLTRIKGKRVFIDEIPEDYDDGILENISCGPECANVPLPCNKCDKVPCECVCVVCGTEGKICLC